MRRLASIVLTLISCAACGGSVAIEIQNDGDLEGLAGSEQNATGTLATEGAYQGDYTLTASGDAGIDFCRIAVDDGALEQEQNVDTTEKASLSLVIDIKTTDDATGTAVCTVEAIKVSDATVSALATARVRIVE